MNLLNRAYCSDPNGNVLEDFFLNIDDELRSTMNCSRLFVKIIYYLNYFNAFFLFLCYRMCKNAKYNDDG